MPAFAPADNPLLPPLLSGSYITSVAVGFPGAQAAVPETLVQCMRSSQQPWPSAQACWVVAVQPGSAGVRPPAVEDGVAEMVWMHCLEEAQVLPYGQQPPPNWSAQRKLEVEGQPRKQQLDTVEDVTVGSPVVVGVIVTGTTVVHWYCEAEHFESQLEPIWQHHGSPLGLT